VVLGKYGVRLEKALWPSRNHLLDTAHTFANQRLLEPILWEHPSWKRKKSILTHGSHWPLKSPTEQDRQEDLDAARKFGNHKNAMSDLLILKSLVMEDVTHSHQLVVPLNKMN